MVAVKTGKSSALQTKLKKNKGITKTNNKETTSILCAAGADTMIFVASLDGPVLNAYIVAYESKFINSTCELQQLYTKYVNQC